MLMKPEILKAIIKINLVNSYSNCFKFFSIILILFV